jgi:hypothetical protein
MPKKLMFKPKIRLSVFYPDFLNFPKPGDMKTDRKLMEEAIRRFLSNRCIENRMVAEAILFFIIVISSFSALMFPW